MIIDCESCPVRGIRCDDCMVTALLTPARAELPLDSLEHRAVATLLRVGLVSADEVRTATARREPWGAARATG